MSDTNLKTASVLAFERKLDPSDALLFSGNWNERDQADAWKPVALRPKSVRGTISNRLKTKDQDPAKLDALLDEAEASNDPERRRLAGLIRARSGDTVSASPISDARLRWAGLAAALLAAVTLGWWFTRPAAPDPRTGSLERPLLQTDAAADPAIAAPVLRSGTTRQRPM